MHVKIEDSIRCATYTPKNTGKLSSLIYCGKLGVGFEFICVY